MGCLGGGRSKDPGIPVTTIATDLDASPESQKKRKKRKGGLYPGEAQRNLDGIQLASTGPLGVSKQGNGLFG